MVEWYMETAVEITAVEETATEVTIMVLKRCLTAMVRYIATAVGITAVGITVGRDHGGELLNTRGRCDNGEGDHGTALNFNRGCSRLKSSCFNEQPLHGITLRSVG